MSGKNKKVTYDPTNYISTIDIMSPKNVLSEKKNKEAQINRLESDIQNADVNDDVTMHNLDSELKG